MLRKAAFLFLMPLLFIQAEAEVVLPRILGHNMVLQRNKPVVIWGTAAAGEQVNVEFAGQKGQSTADALGNWRITLAPLKADSRPAEMLISGTNSIKLQNILVGEVWLCSGQSNMEYTMRKNSKIEKTKVEGQHPVDELKYADNPDIRIFLVNRKTQIKPDSLHRGWSIARDSALRSFSAAGYFFAKELQAKLKVPVGVISAAIPGSAIEPWIPANAFTAAFFDNKKIGGDPGKFYEPMIRPLEPFALKGFLWYQGETNCFQNETIEYTWKMNALISSWRNLWKDSSLPFYYVQLAPFYYSKSKGKYSLTEETLPRFWEAQTLALRIPNTGMIVTTDLVKSPEDLHPGYKWEIGRRLALWALSDTYRMKITPSGPLYKTMQVKGNKILLTFDHTGSGLTSRDGMPLSQFTISGSNGKFVPANAVIRGRKVVVSSSKVTHPENVRFEWNEAGGANFYNKDGLPAVPFRTDNPLKEQFKPSEF